jgi:hopanoid biosynthesis associated protein HpnK
MAKYLIVNADDFGLSPGINAGIIEGFRDGIVTSATLLVNAPAFPEAVQLAQVHPGLGVGIHLNVVRGPAVLPPRAIPTLVDAIGRFRRRPVALVWGLLWQRVALEDLRHEWAAQLERALEAGLRPTHVDSEKHVHMYPPLFTLAVEVAAQYGIRAIRWAGERLRVCAFTRWNTQPSKALLVTLCARRCRTRLAGGAVAANDHFHGMVDTGSLSSPVLRGILTRLEEGVTELMCHPGHLDPTLATGDAPLGPSALIASRAVELRALTAPTLRAEVQALGIRLIHYGDL